MIESKKDVDIEARRDRTYHFYIFRRNSLYHQLLKPLSYATMATCKFNCESKRDRESGKRMGKRGGRKEGES